MKIKFDSCKRFELHPRCSGSAIYILTIKCSVKELEYIVIRCVKGMQIGRRSKEFHTRPSVCYIYWILNTARVSMCLMYALASQKVCCLLWTTPYLCMYHVQMHIFDTRKRAASWFPEYIPQSSKTSHWDADVGHSSPVLSSFP